MSGTSSSAMIDSHDTLRVKPPRIPASVADQEPASIFEVAEHVGCVATSGQERQIDCADRRRLLRATG